MLARNHATPQNGNDLTAYTTDYVLTTGNDWKGPIGRFRLVGDRLAAGNLLSLCWDGALKKTGKASFEFTRDSFAPRRDIPMLVLGPAR